MNQELFETSLYKIYFIINQKMGVIMYKFDNTHMIMKKNIFKETAN